MVKEVSHVDLSGTSTLKIESVDPVEKTVGIERDSQIEKDDEEGDAWEPEEASNEISGNNPSLTSEGPGSFKSLNGKSVSNGSSNHVLVHGSAAGDVNTIPKDDPVVIINKSGNGPPVLNGGVECPPGTMPKHSFASVVGVNQGSSNSTSHTTPTSVSGVYSSASDSVLVLSPSSYLPGTMGTIKHEESQSSLQFTGPSKGSETEVATMVAEANSRLITESNVLVLE